MLAYYTKRSPGEEFEELHKPLMSEMWLDGNNLTDDELELVVKRHELAPNIVYDVRDSQELSRVEYNGEHEVYVFLRAPRLAKSGHIAASPILCVVRPDSFFTLSRRDTFAPELVAHSTMPMSMQNTTDLLLGIIATCIDSYEDLIAHTERSINDTGSRLKSHEVTNQDFIHFVTVEDNLTMYRMNLGGLLSVVDRLKTSTKQVTVQSSPEALDDLSLQIQQLLRAVESYTGRVESIRNAYSTIANNTLNLRIKTLTVFTVLITVPNVFYGMFGMNVALPFPESDTLAYFTIVMFTFVLTLLVYLIAKWRKLF